MHETTQPSLLLRVRDPNNQTAWREFESKYRELIFRYCLRRGLQPSDCDDVQQLVLLNLSKGLRNFEYDPQKGRFRGYLGRVVRHAIAQHFSRPNPAKQALGTAVLAAIGDDGPDSRDDVWEREWVDHHYRLAMQTVRTTFEPRSVEVFEAILAGQTVAQLAKSFDMSEQAVHKVKQRIQARMRTLVAQQTEEEDNPHATTHDETL